MLLADRVALLEDGTITRVGTHAELLADVPEYRYLLAADEELEDLERSCARRKTRTATGSSRSPAEQEAPTRLEVERDPWTTEVEGRSTDIDTDPPTVDEAETVARPGRGHQDDDLPIDGPPCAPRGALPAGLAAAALRKTLALLASSSWRRTLRAFRSRCWWSAASTTASRRSSPAARRKS